VGGEAAGVVDLAAGYDEAHGREASGSGRIAGMEALTTRQVYANAWMTVREDAVRRADGSDGVYGVVDKPDYALVMPWDGARFMLVEQYRYPLGLRRWEFPQGTAPGLADPDPLRLAARELREETGLRAARLEEIGLLDVAPGMSSQRGRVFLATGLTEGRPERELEEQDMRTAWFSRTEFEKMIRTNEITDAQSVAAYALLLLRG
jgi:8-oxo-dGTP pyrophosphatase MutT (NUDIX family)